MRRYKIEGMKELIYSVNQLGQLPQKCVNGASKAGASIARRAAKTKAPVEFGDLRSGIVLKGERTKTKGKKVYQVVFDKALNDVFVKITKSGKRYYYPASQEYGYKLKNGGYMPGLHYMKEALTNNAGAVQDKMIEILSKKIDAVLAKG